MLQESRQHMLPPRMESLMKQYMGGWVEIVISMGKNCDEKLEERNKPGD
jgi:hypothetical protein